MTTLPSQADAVRGAAALPLAPGSVDPGAASGLSTKSHAPWGEVLLLGALTTFGSVALDMYLPALPHIAAVLKASPAAAQMTISVFLFGVAAGQLGFGPLSDRIGRRGPLLAGAALFVAASALSAAVTDMRVLIVLRLLQAVGGCAGVVIARAVVRDRYEDSEVLHVYSLLTLVFGLAPILAPLVGGWVMAVAGWRAIFAVQAAFGLAVGAVAFFRLPESRTEATRRKAMAEHPLRSYAALLAERRLLGLLLTASLSAAALFAYISAAPRVVIGVFAIPAAHFGWVFGANAVGLIVGGQANAWLARRLPSTRLLVIALWASLAAAAVLLADALTGFGGLWGVLVPLFLVVLGYGFSQPNAVAEAMKVDRARAGGTAALLGSMAYGVGALAGAAQTLVGGGPVRAMSGVIVGSLVLALAVHALMVARSARPA